MIDPALDDWPARPPLRVVLIAFEFAPLSSGGVHRAIGFARTLPSDDVELDVVTVRPEDYSAWTSAPLDESLGADLPADVRIHRIASGFPRWYWRLVRNPLGFRLAQYAHWGDPVSLFWRTPLLARLDALVAERRPQVLLVTAPPFGAAVLGLAAARRYRLPLVVDFRDPWSRWGVRPFPTAAHYLYARSLEHALLRRANVSIATSPVTREEWLRDVKGLSGERVKTIHNGYDARDRSGGDPPDRAAARDTCHIVYVGSFYYTPESRAAMFRPLWRRRPHQWLHYRPRREDWLYRSPYFFLRGLARLREREPELLSRLRVTFAGLVPPWLPVMVEDTRTADVVTLTGPLPRASVLQLERAADALLLTSARVEGGKDYSIAGKTFEYLAAGRPILAVLTEGAMRDLIAQSGMGVFADPDDPDAVATAVKRIILAQPSRPLVSPNDAFISQFDRRVLSTQMAEELRRAAAEGYRG